MSVLSCSYRNYQYVGHILFVLLIQGLFIVNLSATPSLNTSATNAQVAAQLEGPRVTISNFTVITGNAQQYGLFSNGANSITVVPQIGIDEGVFLTTSRANASGVPDFEGGAGSTYNAVAGPNDAGGISDDLGLTYTDPELTSIDSGAIYDPIIIQMKTVSTATFLKMVFVFASDEYPEYVCSVFNDPFGIFIKPASLPDNPANWTNIAVIPGTSTPIAVNSINSGVCGLFQDGTPTILTNSQFYVDNGIGTTPANNTNLQFDGFTIPFSVEAPVTVGVTYDVKIAIADAGDGAWDAGLFIKWLSGSNFSADVDLELDLQVNNTSPNAGDNVVFTLQVDNKGQDPASGIQVSFPMPSGFTYVSNTAGAAYNDTTGIWTIPSSLAAVTGTTSLQITATAGGSGSINAFAEISSVSANDIDSTPNNGTQSPVEDDEDTVSLTVTAPSNPPFVCSTGFYQYTESPIDSGNFAIALFNPLTSTYDNQFALNTELNALGYNVLDGYMYGAEIGGNRNLYRIASDGTLTDLGINYASKDMFAGDVDKNGVWYGFNNNNYVVRIDLTQPTLTAVQTNFSSGILNSVADLAYRPTDGKFYGVRAGQLYTFNPADNSMSTSTLTGDMPVTDGAYGAAWVASDGFVYVAKNGDGKVYQINVDTLETLRVATAIGDIKKNDGMACANAASPLTPYDYGDAPDSYGDAQHAVNVSTTNYLGSQKPDSENQTQNTTNGGTDGLGDNNNGTDDEDGISAFPILTEGDTSYSLPITSITANSIGTINLYGWIDFDGNGVFDNDEFASTTVTNSIVNSALNFSNYGTTTSAGTTFARFRLTSDTLNSADVASIASDGEVEDYAITIEVAGFSITGRVYKDINVDGINNDADGISRQTIVLLDVNSNTCVSTRTNANGDYTFSGVQAGDYQLYEAAGETIPMPQNCGIANAQDPVGYHSTTANVFPVFSVINADIPNKDFGDVPKPLLTPDNTGSILPNNVVFYNHQFTASSTGSVDFTSSNTGNVTTGWSSVIYQDANCNNMLDGIEGNVPVAANLPTVAGQTICLLNKVYAPATVTDGETYSNAIRADFNFNNNVIAGITTLTVTDLTKAAASNVGVGTSRLELVKTVENITQGTVETEIQNQAEPRDILKYRIYYRNTGTGILTNPVIYDQIPNFTTLNGMPVCEMPLPASLTNCMPSVNGSSIEWRFPAIDALQGGAGGMVSYEVVVD